MPRERALACAVRLLDRGFFRVGGEEYAEANESYGLATIRREHVTVSGGEARFDFPAKSGQRRVQAVRDRAAIAAIEAMRRRRGGPADLLAYRDGEGGWRGGRSPPRSSGWRRCSATLRRSAAAPTSTPASSTATATGRRSSRRGRGAASWGRGSGAGSSGPCWS